MFVILPLACIWFSEPIGGYVWPNWRGAITIPTRAVFVCIGGWLLLLLPLVIGIGYALTLGGMKIIALILLGLLAAWWGLLTLWAISCHRDRVQLAANWTPDKE